MMFHFVFASIPFSCTHVFLVTFIHESLVVVNHQTLLPVTMFYSISHKSRHQFTPNIDNIMNNYQRDSNWDSYFRMQIVYLKPNRQIVLVHNSEWLSDGQLIWYGYELKLAIFAFTNLRKSSTRRNRTEIYSNSQSHHRMGLNFCILGSWIGPEFFAVELAVNA